MSLSEPAAPLLYLWSWSHRISCRLFFVELPGLTSKCGSCIERNLLGRMHCLLFLFTKKLGHPAGHAPQVRSRKGCLGSSLRLHWIFNQPGESRNHIDNSRFKSSFRWCRSTLWMSSSGCKITARNGLFKKEIANICFMSLWKGFHYSIATNRYGWDGRRLSCPYVIMYTCPCPKIIEKNRSLLHLFSCW